MKTDIRFQIDDVFTEESCEKLIGAGRLSYKPMVNADGEELGNVFFFYDDNHNILTVPVFDGNEMEFGGTIYLDHVDDKTKTKWFKVRRVVDNTCELMQNTFAFLRKPAEPAKKQSKKR